MKTPPPHDPPRWRGLSPGASSVEAEIGAAVRLIDADRGTPAGHGLETATAGSHRVRGARPWMLRGPGWVRRAAVVGASLLMGSAAAALSGKLIQRFNDSRVEPMVTPVSRPAGAPHLSRHRGAPSAVLPGADTQVAAPVVAAATPSAAIATVAQDPDSSSSRSSLPSPPSRPRKLALAEPKHVAAPSPPPVRREPGDDSASVPAAPVEAPVSTALHPPPLELGRAAGSSPTDNGAWVSPAVRLHPEARPARPTLSEAALVSRAIARLRRDHDPAWALDDLAAHDRLYPGGKLNREVALARAEALLALDRHTDALAVLDGLKLERAGTDRRARLARAELRAQEGRRAEAIGDFDALLDGDTDDELVERALYGRAVCRVRGGDLRAARTELRKYRERFPTGAHRADVEKMLRLLGS